MWKAFEEMEALGWIGPERPKMIVVQAAGCQPVVRAFEEGAERSRMWENAATISSGLRVPKPLGDFLILRIVRASGGTCIAVSDEESLEAGARLGRTEGMFVAPEGAACFAAVERLYATGFLSRDERVVVYNTGAGVKYLEAWSERFPRTAV
jgi:threonine synthase